MNLHGNARTTPCSRAEIVRRVKAGQPPKSVATAFGVTVKVVNNWTRRFDLAGWWAASTRRFEAESAAGLEDRSSRPHRLRKPTPPETVARIAALRRQRFTGQQIARETGVSRATVSRILRAAPPSRASELDPPEPVVRYEREHPRELIHLDIKKLGRFDVEGHRVTGDRRKGASRRAGAPGLQPDPARREEGERGRLPGAAVAYYRSLGIAVMRV